MHPFTAVVCFLKQKLVRWQTAELFLICENMESQDNPEKRTGGSVTEMSYIREQLCKVCYNLVICYNYGFVFQLQFSLTLYYDLWLVALDPQLVSKKGESRKEHERVTVNEKNKDRERDKDICIC